MKNRHSLEVKQIIWRNAFTPVWVRSLMCLTGLLLLVSCDNNIDEKRRIAKYQATVNSENGRIVEVNGEEFRIVYIGGVRFRFPEYIGTGHISWTGTSGGPSTGPESDGIYMALFWPDIPPGKSPETKTSFLNSVTVQAKGTSEPASFSESEAYKFKVFGLPYYVSPDDYIVRDDLKLGLRIFSRKEKPNNTDYVYSLKNDAIDPVSGLPVIVSDNYISFRFAPQVSVRIFMKDTTHWKDIYLGVVETLNKYREVK
jgi:hypothetical protein